MKEHVKFCSYHNSGYRIIITIEPSQELTDDLVQNEEEQEILKSVFNESTDIANRRPLERVYQRSMYEIVIKDINQKFNAGKWYESRFSDGTWYVLYTTESELTGIYETIYHQKRFRKEELDIRDISIDLKVIQIMLQTKNCTELVKINGIKTNHLVSKDTAGYPYCQDLAKKLNEMGTAILKTPSARHDSGMCIPVLDLSAIEEDKGHLRYIKGILSKNETKVFHEDKTYKFK